MPAEIFDATVRMRLVQVAPRGKTATFAEAVRLGLSGRPKSLPCRFFYDEIGSELFERICDLPEYYLTRAEDEILRRHASEMVSVMSGPFSLVELGSGSSTKTRRLISASLKEFGSLHYAPIDVSSTILEDSAEALVEEFPELRVTAYAGDYRDALSRLGGDAARPRLIAFLGSSLGNYTRDEAGGLLSSIRQVMGPDDRLLLGTDLAKDRATLEAAYDDASGVTARFNRNLLVRINRELDGTFDVERFGHRARWRPDAGRVEIELVSLADQVVRIPGASLVVSFAEGEGIHTENSHKYRPADLEELAAGSGFAEEAYWTDSEGRFRVQIWRPELSR